MFSASNVRSKLPVAKSQAYILTLL